MADSEVVSHSDTRIKSVALTCTQGLGDPIEDIQRVGRFYEYMYSL
ncbi:hypothetical protein RSAG8_03666, partial [Rhizoctonia solani AG-8 WAC10335]